MPQRLYRLFDAILVNSFYALFFIIPLLFTTANSELFEFNKMMLTYALAMVIVACWAVKCILAGQLIFRRTPLDLPIFIFFVSQFLSSLVSIDIHTSIWGYYTRSHGGLLSTIAYITLFYAFVSNMDKRKTQNVIRYLLLSGIIVSVWGILEHFGKSPSCLFITGRLDVSCWVQDVQTRVFATLGQPNWMAAWLVAVTPLAWALTISKTLNAKGRNVLYLVLPNLLFLAILFTKSRSGLLGFAVAFTVFWGITFVIHNSKFLIRPFALLVTCYLVLVTIFGTPWTPSLLEQNAKRDTQNVETGTVLERGGTESGEIRKIVWKGALDIWKAYPLFGSGVETFAYSYYNFRPVEHNYTSEWNFLYNKAHNEYLNFLATTGVFGLGSYLVLIMTFLWCSLKNIKYQILKIKNTDKNLKNFDIFNCHFDIYILNFALLAGFTSILVTNFFGFSVVPVALLFFLYPAMAFTLNAKRDTQNGVTVKLGLKDILSAFAVLLFAFYALLRLGQIWYADKLYAQGDKKIDGGEIVAGANKLEEAIKLRPDEPLYYDKLAGAYSIIAAALAEEGQKDANEIAEKAKDAADKAFGISPRNINLLKTRASTFTRLAFVDPAYLNYSVITLESAIVLAPTDPLVHYRLGLARYRTGNAKEAIKTLERAIELKPNYTDGYFALAEIYTVEGEKEKAKERLEYILKNIDPTNQVVKEKLERLYN